MGKLGILLLISLLVIGFYYAQSNDYTFEDILNKVINFIENLFNLSSCYTSCISKQCGSDGCGGSCGACLAGQTCTNNQCINSSLVCTPNWQCSSWSSCINNKKTKTCIDSNDCNSDIGKPLTIQNCTPGSLDCYENGESPTCKSKYSSCNYICSGNNCLEINDIRLANAFPSCIPLDICVRGTSKCLDNNCKASCLIKSKEQVTIDYTNYLNNNLRIKSFSLDAISNKQLFFDYLYSLESQGEIDIEKPTLQNQGYCYIEEDKYYINNFAFAVWLDKNNIVPWKLSDYTDDELRIIFNKDRADGGIIAYSPSKTLEYTKYYILQTELETINAIVNSVRNFEHSSSGDPYYCLYLEDAINEKISRAGCHTMAELVSALCTNLNIPAYYKLNRRDNNWYLSGHASIIFQDIGFIPHGDELYRYTGIDTNDLIIPWNYLQSNVMGSQCCYNDSHTYNPATKQWMDLRGIQ